MHSLLDPIIYQLLDPSIRRLPTTSRVHTKDLPGFLYENSFDQRCIHHLLQTLLAVVKFGGMGLAKVMHTALIKKSFHVGLLRRVEEGKFCHFACFLRPDLNEVHIAGVGVKDVTYLEVLSDVLVR